MPTLLCSLGAPTIKEVGERYAGRSLDADELLAILEQCLLQWTEMATAFYFFVRPTLILTGEHERDDLEIVATRQTGVFLVLRDPFPRLVFPVQFPC